MRDAELEFLNQNTQNNKATLSKLEYINIKWFYAALSRRYKRLEMREVSICDVICDKVKHYGVFLAPRYLVNGIVELWQQLSIYLIFQIKIV